MGTLWNPFVGVLAALPDSRVGDTLHLLGGRYGALDLRQLRGAPDRGMVVIQPAAYSSPASRLARPATSCESAEFVSVDKGEIVTPAYEFGLEGDTAIYEDRSATTPCGVVIFDGSIQSGSSRAPRADTLMRFESSLHVVVQGVTFRNARVAVDSTEASFRDELDDGRDEDANIVVRECTFED